MLAIIIKEHSFVHLTGAWQECFFSLLLVAPLKSGCISITLLRR